MAKYRVIRTPVLRNFLSLWCPGCRRDVVLTVDGKTLKEITPISGKRVSPDIHSLRCPFCGYEHLTFHDQWQEMHEHLSVESGYEPQRHSGIGPEEPGY